MNITKRNAWKTQGSKQALRKTANTALRREGKFVVAEALAQIDEDHRTEMIERGDDAFMQMMKEEKTQWERDYEEQYWAFVEHMEDNVFSDDSWMNDGMWV